MVGKRSVPTNSCAAPVRAGTAYAAPLPTLRRQNPATGIAELA